jgi:hypothetical protein
MRTFLVAASVASLLGCSEADLDRLPLDAAAISELTHAVTVRMHRGSLILTVKREFRNDTGTYRELTQPLGLPDGAIVTSFRVGTEAVLLGAEDATTRWSELTSPGAAAPTTSAILEWSSSGELTLGLFGVSPFATLPVEYDIQLPPSYEAGGWAFVYPRDDAAGAAPSFDLTRTPGASVDGTTVRLPRAPIDHTDAKWALYRLGSDRTMWRFELDAAQILEPAPVRPNVVFVIDASHSQRAEGIAAQLQLLEPYLSHVPDAQVEIILYRRFAERLFNRFIPASDVARMLASTPPERLKPGNGSNLDLGARLAAEALAQVGGVGRIILFTDEELRDDFSSAATISDLQQAPRDTVVHLVARDRHCGTGELTEERVEGDPLGLVAAASGGVFLRISGQPGAQAPATMLSLVRPTRIDDFQVEAKGLDTDRLDAPATLLEGDTLRFTAIASRPPTEVTVTGKIWAREYRKVVPIDPDLSQWMPGLAIGLSEVESQLSDDEVLTAARTTQAVSRMTSYLAAQPMAGASTIGALDGDLVDHGFGSMGCGGTSTSTCGGGFRLAQRPPDLVPLLRRLMSEGIAACAQTHGVDAPEGSVTIEATDDEVVSVQTTAASGPLAACLAEVAWSVRLTEAFARHRTYVVDF